MKRLLLLALFVPRLASAQDAHDPARLFTHEAPIQWSEPAGSMIRLALPSEVLVRVRPDLSDLRIHDREGGEVPFLVDSGARPWPNDAALPSHFVAPVAFEQRVESGGSLRAHWTEVLAFHAPGPAPPGARWTIELDSRRGSFVRAHAVRAIAADGIPTELVSGSVFRLAAPRRERLAIDLPAFSEGQLLELTLSGEGGYIEPTLRMTATRDPIEAPTLVLPLERVREERADGATWITIERPTGLVPDRIGVRTSTANFHRTVRVVDVSAHEGEREIGRAQLFRARDVAGAEVLSVDIAPARGERLRVEIEDGDSPPLRGLALDAIVRQPTLLFDAPAGGGTLRFGGGRARPARYDLSRFVGTILGEAIFASELGQAELDEVRENPRFDDGPALRFAMRPGRAVAVDRYTHVAPLTVAGADEGLSRVRLPPSVLAAARADLADVRVVDARGRQWPYLRSPHDESERVGARPSRPEADGTASRYRIALPVSRARIDRVFLFTDAPYVARPFVLRGIDDDERWVELASGTLLRSPDGSAPLEIAASGPRVSALELVIEDGSDAPIVLTRAEISVPSPTLFLAAPDGAYRVLAGDAEAARPDYEIARARTLVLAVRAADARVGRTARNAAHVEPPWYTRADLKTWILWTVLLLAVLLLGGLTLRLARSDDEEPPPDPPPPPPDRAEDAPPPAPEEPPPDATKPVSF